MTFVFLPADKDLWDSWALSLTTAAQWMLFVQQTDKCCGREETILFLQLRLKPAEPRAAWFIRNNLFRLNMAVWVRVQRLSLRQVMLCTDAYIVGHMLCMRSHKHTILLHLQRRQAGWQVHLLLMIGTQHWLAESAQFSDRYMDSCQPANVHRQIHTVYADMYSE